MKGPGENTGAGFHLYFLEKPYSYHPGRPYNLRYWTKSAGQAIIQYYRLDGGKDTFRNFILQSSPITKTR